MQIEYDKDFWYDGKDKKSRVFQIFPDVHGDTRGSFVEDWQFTNKNEHRLSWIFQEKWMAQMNTSVSKSLVLRGCHAQSGNSCQAKLVKARTYGIFDFITDARPNSETFQKTKVYYLNPKTQNSLFIPRGFLHAFATGADEHDRGYIFSYMCDNGYNPEKEVTVCPVHIVLPAFEEHCDRNGVDNFLQRAFEHNELNISPKDYDGRNPGEFFETVATDWVKNGVLWYVKISSS